MKINEKQVVTVVGEKKEIPLCFHCGDQCQTEIIPFDNKSFCCSSCKTVYEILQENDLSQFYDFEKHPGKSLSRSADAEKFLFLDNKQIQDQLLNFKSDSLHKVSFLIPQVHCSSCIWLLENLQRLHPGVLHSRVNFMRKEVYLDYEPAKISLREVVELLSSLGYEPQINLDSGNRKNQFQRKQNRRLLMKIGVAGFCFGNIMLLSFPDYLGLDMQLETQLKNFFYYLNIVLAFPVVFYSGWDYFISAAKGLKQKFVNIDVPIALGIFVLFFRSVFEIVYSIGPGYLDSLAGLVFFLLVGRWFQSKTYENLSFERDYKSYFPLAVNRYLENKLEVVQVNELKPDDEYLIRNQEIIPCDSILLEGEADIDYSFVTGEARSVTVSAGELIYAGGKQKGSKLKLRVKKAVSQSYLTQLWNHDTFGKEKEDQKTYLVNQISKYFTLIILLIALLSLGAWWMSDPARGWDAFTAVLIVACPCALSLSTPFTLGSTTRIFGRNRLYLKNTSAIETMSLISHIVFDKTGTLTEIRNNQMEYQGSELSPFQTAALKSLSSNSTHPLSKSIFESLNAAGELLPVQNYQEFTGLGIEGIIGEDHFRIGSLEFMGADPGMGLQPGEQGVSWSLNGEVQGKFVPKARMRQGIEQIDSKNSDFRFSLLSGDQESERLRFEKVFPRDTAMIFRCKPEDKLQYIQQLQEKGEKVLMVGDGLNDAGALQQADIGIAVTESTTAFSPASDAILDAGSFSRLFKLIDFSKMARTIIIISFIISFLYNILGLAYAVTGNLTPIFAAILMPLSSISVVGFTTLAVHFTAKFKQLI